MNYRHAFHAGNFADVFKHAVLLALLRRLTAKAKPFCYLETHAGRGLYPLETPEAQQTAEWRDGIGRMYNLAQPPAALLPYLAAIRTANDDGALTRYPGSPWLAAHIARPTDALVLCELQREEANALRGLFRHDARVHVHTRDGYAALNALLPPHEHRGGVLIDPPFEAREEEFTTILQALVKAHARWPDGVYAVWYPIKLRRSIVPFHRHLARGPFAKLLAAELLVRRDDSPLRLNGCGMLIANPPWQLDAKLAALLPALKACLAQASGATYTLRWLRND